MRQSGFTLIETVIALGLFIVLLFAFLQIFEGTQQIFLTQQNVTDVAGSASLLMTDITAAAAQADQVLSSYTFSGTTYSTNAATLVLELPTVNSSGNIVSGAHDYIAFYSSAGNAYEIASADPSSARQSGTKKLSDALSSMAFTYDNATYSLVTSVDTDIVTQATADGLTPNAHLNQLTYLRNTF